VANGEHPATPGEGVGLALALLHGATSASACVR
jgi:hypothetical protein